MGALARRLGRHRSGIAGAAGLIVALSAPHAAHAAPRLVSWERSGGLAPTGRPAMRIETDRTIRATGDDPAAGTEARITRDEKALVKRRLRRFGEPVRAKGHRVRLTSGGDPPPRLVRLLNLLARLHDRYLGEARGASR
jgi:hypothetical protein